MRIRVMSNAGWNEENKKLVIKTCQEHNLPFVDRAAVADDEMLKSIRVIHEDPSYWIGTSRGPREYVFFTHREMRELPYDLTVGGFGYNENRDAALRALPANANVKRDEFEQHVQQFKVATNGGFLMYDEETRFYDVHPDSRMATTFPSFQQADAHARIGVGILFGRVNQYWEILVSVSNLNFSAE